MTSTLNEHANNESWGVKNFRIEIKECPKGCIICGKNSLDTCSKWKIVAQSFLNPSGDPEGWIVTGA